MCGIAGVFDTGGPPAVETLEAMNDCISHRGLDAAGTYVDGPVGFAHRRLAIIDPDAGAQPLFNEDGTIAVAFNGEIYNYRALRGSLSGHTFRTDTDTEVLVHLYEEHGPSFVKRLEGMFAFALWDRDVERLLLARDRMGIKPLFLATDGKQIGFASELPALLESPVEQGGLDRRAISEYFTLGYVPAPRTAFRNVEKVSPGEMVTVSDGSIERHQYYRPSIDTVDKSFEDAADGVRERVVDAVDKRLMSDVPLGAFLSGGIDSSIVAGVMAQRSETPVRTFTVGFESDRFDESEAARTVAEFHDTDHTEYTVSVDDVREVVPTVLDRLGEPFADPSIIPTYVVSRETSNDVKVALSGDGADELFAGYNRYRGEYYSRFYRSVPRTIRSMLVEPAMKRLPATRSSAVGEAVRKAQEFSRVDESDPAGRHFEWVRKAPPDASVAYRDCEPFDAGAGVLQREHESVERLLPPERADDMARMLAVDTYYGLPDQLLRKVDRASMYNSLEVRVPFLDTDVVEYALGLPTDYKITARSRKRVLKAAFDDLLPQAIQNRSKQGFEMPIGEWLKDDLSDQFRRTVRDSRASLLDSTAILDLHDRHTSGRRDYEWFLWNVYVFTRWYARMRRQGYLDE